MKIKSIIKLIILLLVPLPILAKSSSINPFITNQNTPITINQLTEINSINISSIDLSTDDDIQKDITNAVGRFQVNEMGSLTFSPKVTFTGTTYIDIYYSTMDGRRSNIRYNFEVIPQAICSQSIEAKSFTTANGVQQVFNMPATDYGFQFDIYSLDNSFNLTINGTPLITDLNHNVNSNKRHELEFQSDQTVNVTFEDNTVWGNNNIPQIYNMVGNANNPIVRVLISPEGAVSLYGSKVSNGPLHKLKLKNNVSFNNITWHTTSENVVIANQRVVSITNMKGFGTGLKVRSCPCTKPGLSGTSNATTPVGVSILKEKANDFPNSIPNGFIAFESASQGFVISRIQNSNLITDPKKGMLIYDIDHKCVKMYNGTRWECLYISCNVHEPGATNTH